MTKPETVLQSSIKSILSRVAVNDGQFELTFSEAYMLTWKAIRDYYKSINIDPSKIKKPKPDPIFDGLNNFMYGDNSGDIDLACKKILQAIDKLH